MKKLYLLTIALVSMMLLSACGDKPVTPDELPQEIQSFVKQHFPEQTIMFVNRDRELFGSEYDVTLADGTRLSFDTNNVWYKVSCPTKGVPAALIPAPIATQVNTKFADVYIIVKIEKERDGYEVKLVPKPGEEGYVYPMEHELKFDKQGALMKVDD